MSISKMLLVVALAAGLLFTGILIGLMWGGGIPLKDPLNHKHDLGEAQADEIEYWTCTMHPSVKMKQADKCPICAMDLVAVKKKTAAPPPGAAGEADVEAAADNSVFQVDPRRQQLINVQTAEVRSQALQKVIRTVANLELDETQVRHVNPKIKGWIEKVFVDFTLQHVKKGEPLFSVYSPELVATQEEYLLALRTAENLGQSPFDFVSNGARSLLQATRRRLELFDVTEEQIEALEQSGKIQKSLIVHSPVSGHVLQKNAFENMYVTPETTVYTVADHTRIWAQAEIYENEIQFIYQGQPVAMTVAAFPGRSFRGKISYLYPHLNKQTRTMRARLEFPNPDLKLKPEMYANIEIQVPLGKRLAVPESAVLRTGTRDLVFVDLGAGSMQLRRVELGAKAGGFYEVLRGLEAGERVVSAANFLIDAESRVQGVEASWETPKPMKDRAPGQRPQ